MSTTLSNRPRLAVTPSRSRDLASVTLTARRPTRAIDDLLRQARSGLDRLNPAAALAAWRGGAVVVDIRPAAQRAVEGELPGALIIERNVLERRFDPSSDARLPIAHRDLLVIVLCQEGDTSSLAAAALQEVGVRRATDVVGGYAAWRAGTVRRWAELLIACPDAQVEAFLTS